VQLWLLVLTFQGSSNTPVTSPENEKSFFLVELGSFLKTSDRGQVSVTRIGWSNLSHVSPVITLWQLTAELLCLFSVIYLSTKLWF